MNALNARGGKLKRMIQGGALGLLAASVFLGLWRAGVLDTLEFPTWGWRVRTFAPRSSPSSDVKVILLDQASLDWGQKENGWVWPWPRTVYTAVLDFCKRGGAKAVVFDMLYTEPSSYGVDDDKAARDLIEALHDLLDGFDAGKFDDLEWSWLAQISDLTRTGTQSEAIVLPEDLVGDRLRAQHCRIRSAITTGWAECSGCGCSARSRRMRSTSDDLQRAHSAESAQVSEMVPSSGRQASSMSKSASRCSSVTPCRAATSAMRQSTKLCMVYPRARPVR